MIWEYCKINSVEELYKTQNLHTRRGTEGGEAPNRCVFKKPKVIQITGSAAAEEPNLLEAQETCHKENKGSSEFRCLLEDQDNLHTFTFLQTLSLRFASFPFHQCGF